MNDVVQTRSSIHLIVSRLRMFLDEETTQIGNTTNYDFQESSERKSRLLFELNRASRGADQSAFDSTLVEELKKLQLALQKNEERIKAHLSAMREISSLMVGVLKNQEADGTYQEFF